MGLFSKSGSTAVLTPPVNDMGPIAPSLQSLAPLPAGATNSDVASEPLAAGRCTLSRCSRSEALIFSS
jgi:hypothetical protein